MGPIRAKVAYMTQPNALLTTLYAVYLLNIKTLERKGGHIVVDDLVQEGDSDEGERDETTAE